MLCLRRYWHTLRPVPVGRLGWRVWRRLRHYYQLTPVYGAMLERLPAPMGPQVQPPQLWPGDKAHGQDIIDKNRFHFVGHAYDLADKSGAMNWEPSHASPLWLFHLHYWDFMADLRAVKTKQAQEKARMLAEDWLLSCDVYQPVIWHSYPTSLRLVNMLTYADWILRDASPQLQEAYLHSLIRQATHLRHNMEWDLGENHLMKNIKALLYVAVCLPRDVDWFDQTLAWLKAACQEQIGPEGMHCERSPSYHVQVLIDLLDVQALLRKARYAVPHWLEAEIENMGQMLACLRHPDGGLALMNDGAMGDAALLDVVQKKAGATRWQGAMATTDGFVTAKTKQAYLLADVGGVSPARNPGHAHAQALCFEYSYGTQRVFVNRGTYGYQHARRHELRSTAAHNALTIEDANHTDVWSHFRVGKRPRVWADTEGLTTKLMAFSGGHNGYKAYGIQHTRHWQLAADGSLTGRDVLTGRHPRKVRVYFHLHPDVRYRQRDEQAIQLKLPDGQTLVFKVDGGRLFSQPTTYAPQFGVFEKTTVLVIQARSVRGEKVIHWHLGTTSK